MTMGKRKTDMSEQGDTMAEVTESVAKVPSTCDCGKAHALTEKTAKKFTFVNPTGVEENPEPDLVRYAQKGNEVCIRTVAKRK